MSHCYLPTADLLGRRHLLSAGEPVEPPGTPHDSPYVGAERLAPAVEALPDRLP